MDALAGLALPILFIAVLYLLLIRPQQKRAKEHRNLVSNLSVGDDVVTIGGMHGRVVDLTDETMDLVVAAVENDDGSDDEIVLRFQRSSIARVVSDHGGDEAADEAADEPADESIDEDADEA